MTCPEVDKSIRWFGRRCAPTESAQDSRRMFRGRAASAERYFKGPGVIAVA